MRCDTGLCSEAVVEVAGASLEVGRGLLGQLADRLASRLDDQRDWLGGHWASLSFSAFGEAELSKAGGSRKWPGELRLDTAGGGCDW